MNGLIIVSVNHESTSPPRPSALGIPSLRSGTGQEAFNNWQVLNAEECKIHRLRTAQIGLLNYF